MAQNNNNKVDFHRLGSELWDIANIFRDDTLKTTEYLEEFSYFLFLKLFDDKEKQKEEVARLEGTKFIPDLPNHLRFSTWAEKILASDGKTVKTNDAELPIVDYVRKIFSELAEVKDHDGRDLSLFRRLFKNHIWRIRYNPTIKELIKRLKDFELEQNFDVMGRAYEFVVQKLGEQKQYGQYFTPRHIIHFMVELADPEIGEKIYDPAAGTGGFILRAFEVVNGKIDSLVKAGMRVNEATAAYDGVKSDEAEILYRKLTRESLFAVEKAPDVYKLALMNMILHNDGNSNLKEADSLDNWAQLEHKEKYDVVLTNPPYGSLAQSRVGTFEFHAKRYEALFIQHIMAALRPSEPDKKRSRAVVIILDKILFDNSSVFKNIRMKLLREFDLKAVFSMPAGIFQPYSGVKTTVLYFEKPTKEEWNEIKKQNTYTTKQVLFVDVKDDGFTLTTQRRPINGAFQGDDPNIYEPPCGNLPKAVEVFKKWIDWIKAPTEALPDFINNDFCWTATIEEIKAKDYNLNPGLYRKTIKGKQNWEVIPLKEVLLSLETGRRPQGGVSNINEGIPSIGGEHIDTDGSLKLDDMKYIPAEFFNTLTSGIIEDNNILIVKDGATTGKVAYINNLPFEKAAVNEHVFLLKADTEKILPQFLFYVLYSEYGQNQILMYKKGAAQGGITRDILDNIQIPIPPLPIQQEMVARLDKQQAIIEQCNALEKAILEAGIDDSIFEGDWEWVELPNVVEINPESINPENEPEKEFIYIDISSVDNKTFTITDYKFISGKNAPSRARRVVKIGDVLISTVRPNLKSFCIIDDERFNNQICSTGFAVLRSKVIIQPRFLFFYALSDIFVSKLTKLMEKSQYPSITQADLSNIKVPLPSIEKQQEIVNILNTQFKTLANIRRLKENAKQTIKMILDREVFGE